MSNRDIVYSYTAMDTHVAFNLLIVLLIGNFERRINGCEQMSGVLRLGDRLKLKGLTNEDLLQLPKCLRDNDRIFVILIQDSNFTLPRLVTVLPERVKQSVVDLEINRCSLSRIPAGILSQLPKLRYINLRNNGISELEKESFVNMTELQSIILSNNSLRAIHTATFVNLPLLNEISLQNNQLQELSKNAFWNVPSLVVIYLDNNRLHSLPYRSFTTSPIKFMHVANNRITEISSEIQLFNDLVNLDIRNNSLTMITKYISTLKNLHELHLTWNNLTTLPVELSALLGNATLNIALGNNPWHCDCNIAWLISWVKEGFTQENIVCETPLYINMSQFDISLLHCEQRELKTDFPMSGYVTIAVVIGLVLIATCVTVMYICIRNNKSKKIKRPIKMIVNGQYYIPQSDEDNSEQPANSSQPRPEDCTLQQKQNFESIQFGDKKGQGFLRLGKRLGRGAFGDVFEGLAKESKNGTWKKVAIKRIRDSAADNDSENLITEYQRLTDIGRHPNIIQVYGIGKLEDSLIMVMELAENGDMLIHLKEIERTNQRTIRNLDSSEEKFYLENRHSCLFMYMWHVAKGMEYLSQLKVVHRDLAARNILLAAGNVAKLSDFGLSRDVYENGYYYQNSKGRLPYKWMSPETLSNGKFTSSSDVWSFGVLLWEIMTLGSTPYPGIPPDMLVNMYKSKYIMPQPPLCPDTVYAVMKSCWKHDPEERTNFTLLVDKLDGLIQTFSKKHYMDVVFDQKGDDQVALIEGDSSSELLSSPLET